jgi:regulator of cell morphogenesis and NO signaling
MLIQKEMKLADVLHHDHNLVPVINRFDIHLGFGDATIAEICDEKKINLEFFLTILNAYHDHQYFPKKHFQSFSASSLVSYLSKSHNYYLEEKVPEIESYIDELNEQRDLDTETYLLLKNFFTEYKRELTQHIDHEENKVYPYVEKLERYINLGITDDNLREEMETFSIHNYEEDHDDVEAKLYDLKNIIIKYLPPTGNDSSYYKVLRELFMLENDLNDHSRIEDLILVPKVEAMEFSVRNMLAKDA